MELELCSHIPTSVFFNSIILLSQQTKYIVWVWNFLVFLGSSLFNFLIIKIQWEILTSQCNCNIPMYCKSCNTTEFLGGKNCIGPLLFLIPVYISFCSLSPALLLEVHECWNLQRGGTSVHEWLFSLSFH